MRALIVSALSCTLLAGLGACHPEAGSPDGLAAASGTGTAEDPGAHLLLIAGCNDCHTPGFGTEGVNVPESLWYTGTSMGWQGPWGTSYATNLRLSARSLSEDLWVQTMQVRRGLPPMPWASLHAMTSDELRAIHRYLAPLEPEGSPVPDPLPHGVEPSTPYIVLMPVVPEVSAINSDVHFE